METADTLSFMPSWAKFREGFLHAFAVKSRDELTEDDREILLKIVRGIRKRGLALPASIFIQSTRPLNMVGSQVLVGLQPFVEMVVASTDWERLARALEKRPSIDFLVEQLEREEERTGAANGTGA